MRSDNRPSTVRVKLSRADISGDYVYPFPKKPEAQAKLEGMKYRNMLEQVAERYHTTPRTIVALNGPTALIGIGQTLRLPNVLPASTDYARDFKDEHVALFRGPTSTPNSRMAIISSSTSPKGYSRSWTRMTGWLPSSR